MKWILISLAIVLWAAWEKQHKDHSVGTWAENLKQIPKVDWKSHGNIEKAKNPFFYILDCKIEKSYGFPLNPCNELGSND